MGSTLCCIKLSRSLAAWHILVIKCRLPGKTPKPKQMNVSVEKATVLFLVWWLSQLKRHSRRMVEITVYQQVNCSLNIPLHRASLSAFSLTHLFGQNTPLLRNLTSVVDYALWKAIIVEVHIFWPPKTSQVNSVTQVHEISKVTNCQKAARATCMWKGRRAGWWARQGGQWEQWPHQGAGMSSSKSGSGSGLGTAMRDRHSPVIAQCVLSDEAAPSQEAQAVGLAPGSSLEVRAWHRHSLQHGCIVTRGKQ